MSPTHPAPTQAAQVKAYADSCVLSTHLSIQRALTAFMGHAKFIWHPNGTTGEMERLTYIPEGGLKEGDSIVFQDDSTLFIQPDKLVAQDRDHVDPRPWNPR